MQNHLIRHTASAFFALVHRHFIPVVTFAVALASATVAGAQAIVPRYVQFQASSDHNATLSDGRAAVTSYQIEFTLTGASSPFQTAGIGKPAPAGDGSITHDLSSTTIAWPVAGGTYQARVTAIGPNGSGRSEPSAAFVVGSAPPTPATYEVGTGRQYATLRDVPWDVLAPGSTVRLYWQSAPYRHKILLSAAGTASAPIVLQGVASSTGARPVIDGNGATTAGVIGGAFETLGVVSVAPASATAPLPANIVIENLEVVGARSNYTFTSAAGTVSAYAAGAASVYVENGQNVIVRNCLLHDSGQGVNVASTGATVSQNVTLVGNYVYANGYSGSTAQHNVSAEAVGLTVEANRFGPLQSGARGAGLYDRSAGLVVRFNWIEGGERELDLVDARSATVRSYASYGQATVYGNVILEPNTADAAVVVRYGGDSGTTTAYRQQRLHFYNNTVVSARTSGTTLLEVNASGAQADLRNNIVSVPAGSGLVIGQGTGTIDVYNHWLTTGYQRTATGFTGVLTESGRVVTGSAPGFTSPSTQDFTLAAGATSIDAGGSLSSSVLPTHNVTAQYVRHQQWTPRTTVSMVDLGAFESGSTAPSTYSVTGRIVDANGTGRANVSVAISGGVTGTAVTSSTGAYSFANVPRWGSVTVTPTSSVLVFSPASQSFSNVSANVTADFVAADRPNTAPTVSITTPVHGASFVAPASIAIAATAADSDDGVARVDFYNGATLVASDPTSPYGATAAGLAAGSYTFTAVAVDTRGATTTSTPAVVTVTAPAPISLTPTADAYVRAWPSGSNYGGATTLAVRASSARSALRESYMTFDTTSVTAGRRVVLRLMALVTSSGVSVPGAVYPVSTTTWGESTITYANRPAAGATALATFSVSSTTTTAIDIDVTTYVQAERAAGRTRVSFALRGTANTSAAVQFPSKEAASNRPTLLVQ